MEAFSSVQFSRSVMSDSLRSHEPQHTRPTLSINNSRSPPKPMSIESAMPSNHLILCHPLLLLPSIFPSISVFSNESALCIRWPKYPEFQLHHQSFQWIFTTGFQHSNIPMNIHDYDWLVGFPCSPRDSEESTPTPQFKSINSSVLRFLYRSTLTSIHDYWKNHRQMFVGKVMYMLFNNTV